MAKRAIKKKGECIVPAVYLSLWRVLVVCLSDCSVLPSALPIHNDFCGHEPRSRPHIRYRYRVHWISDYGVGYSYRPAVA